MLLLRAEQPDRFAAGEPPAWVSEWLAGRAAKERKKEEKAQDKALTPEEVAAAAARELKRQTQRWARIEAAAGDLQRWIADLAARGRTCTALAAIITKN